MHPTSPVAPSDGSVPRHWLVTTLALLLDAFGVPAALFDEQSGLLHHSADLAALAGDPAAGGALWPVLGRVAAETLASTPMAAEPTDIGAPAAYRLTAVVLPTEPGLPRLVVVRLGAVPSAPRDALQRLGELTRREAEVVRLLARGRRDAEIATALGISRHTARRHVERILRKLGVKSRAQAVARLLGVEVPDPRGDAPLPPGPEDG